MLPENRNNERNAAAWPFTKSTSTGADARGEASPRTPPAASAASAARPLTAGPQATASATPVSPPPVSPPMASPTVPAAAVPDPTPAEGLYERRRRRARELADADLSQKDPLRAGIALAKWGLLETSITFEEALAEAMKARPATLEELQEVRDHLECLGTCVRQVERLTVLESELQLRQADQAPRSEPFFGATFPTLPDPGGPGTPR